MSLSDSHHFRKMVAGACMVLAPLCLLVAAVIHPGLDTDEAAQIGLITESRDAYFAAQAFGLASIVLAIPAVLGLMHMLREREVSAGHLGGAFALVGLVAFAAATGMAIALWQASAGAEADAVALLVRLRDSTGAFLAVLLPTWAFPIGMAALAGGLARARTVPAPVAGALALGAIGVALAFTIAMTWVLVLSAALLVVGFGAIGLMVLRETDADWEHTPQFHGFRPAGGAPAA